MGAMLHTVSAGEITSMYIQLSQQSLQLSSLIDDSLQGWAENAKRTGLSHWCRASIPKSYRCRDDTKFVAASASEGLYELMGM